jgi:argininosuccinate lyase
MEVGGRRSEVGDALGETIASGGADLQPPISNLQPPTSNLSSNLLWGGRFATPLDAGALAFTSSLGVDRRLYSIDILGSIAHARMLGRTGIVPAAEADIIVAGLRDLMLDPPSLDAGYEDIHSLVEATLTERVGAAAGRLHTARSRNDQVATDTRLWARGALVDGVVGVAGLIEALLGAVARQGETVMPGYTHLQRAQPVLLGHHLLAYVEMFGRDADRLCAAYARADVLPLGAGALAGAPYPLDRDFVATVLGFGAVSRNSLDAVSDRDFLVEHVADLALVAMHLSRLAEELVLWSTSEFGFIALDEAYTTGSSIMPQKRNPDVAELVRGKAGRVYGDLIALLTTLKALPLSYNRDLQEDKAPLFDAVDTVHDGLRLMAAMIEGAIWRDQRLAEAADDGLIAATDLADHLARHGLPFRQAHEVVGRIVRDAETSNRSLASYSLDELHSYSALFEADAVGLRAPDLAAARDVPGGTAPARVRTEARTARGRLAALRAWAAEHAARLPTLESVMA